MFRFEVIVSNISFFKNVYCLEYAFIIMFQCLHACRDVGREPVIK
jgi:hypothetical protein